MAVTILVFQDEPIPPWLQFDQHAESALQAVWMLWELLVDIGAQQFPPGHHRLRSPTHPEPAHRHVLRREKPSANLTFLCQRIRHQIHPPLERAR
jgi:hypothetical protein